MKTIMVALLLAALTTIGLSASLPQTRIRKGSEGEYRDCMHICDKDLVHCILTCEHKLEFERDVTICDDTCYKYKGYCTAHCLH